MVAAAEVMAGTNEPTSQALALLADAAIVFWDFDGVIKESVEVKSSAFERLFEPFGREIAARVREHHESHCGMSRYEKVPIYLRWAGEPGSPHEVQTFCERFGHMVKLAVISAAWVPGVHQYLESHYRDQHFVLVTATPQQEIEDILQAVELRVCFREVFGAPTSKGAAIRDVVARWECAPDECLMVGDAETDLIAARDNGVPFLLRRTSRTRALQEQYAGPSFDDLHHE